MYCSQPCQICENLKTETGAMNRQKVYKPEQSPSLTEESEILKQNWRSKIIEAVPIVLRSTSLPWQELGKYIPLTRLHMSVSVSKRQGPFHDYLSLWGRTNQSQAGQQPLSNLLSWLSQNWLLTVIPKSSHPTKLGLCKRFRLGSGKPKFKSSQPWKLTERPWSTYTFSV